MGRCRAWLRLALMQKKLSDYWNILVEGTILQVSFVVCRVGIQLSWSREQREIGLFVETFLLHSFFFY